MENNRLHRMIYDWEKENEDNDNSWAAYTKKLLENLNLDDYLLKQKTTETIDEWNKIIHDKIQDREQRELLQRAKLKPKLRTYIKYKKKLREEEYLKNEDAIGRRMLARIR